MSAAPAPRAQCTGILEAHGRRWRCTRLAAKKYAGKLCGFCASLRPLRCRQHLMNTGKVQAYHSAACFTEQQACDLAGDVLVAGQDRKAAR